MKKIGWILSLLAIFSVCGRQAGIRFEKMGFDAALQKAQSEQKLLLTYFYTDW
ncbi:MAG TPA: hypothetical protein P5268_05645 [Candidatus Marinimicrobia bacterium]|nr:hypothetical protein [Candidatus Neomarinimicrobiota bacterium]HRS52127.1 hypothetical protein [Candidatus Neomarinimicrobiota bacterium]HRU92496.1 hypothetical protein [Candidatus Neomarinimicrobiota bacterium]